MKKLLILIAFLPLGLLGQSVGFYHAKEILDTIPDGYSTQYQAVLDYATSQGYTLPSDSTKAFDDSLVTYWDGTGDLAKLDAFWKLKTDGDENFSKINWINPGSNTATFHNGFWFTSGVGWQGDGLNDYADLHWNPTDDGSSYTLGTASIFLKIGSNQSTNAIDGFDISNTSGRVFIRTNNGGKYEAVMHTSGTTINGGTSASSIAPFLLKLKTNTLTLYRDGVSAISAANTPTVLPTQDYYLGAAHFNTNNTGNSTRIYEYVGFGGDLSTTFGSNLP